MASTYCKPFATFEEQLALLEKRGLLVEDRAAAMQLLQSVGYYTLGGYLYPMREMAPGPGLKQRRDEFVQGASFEQMADLYRFDRSLRLLVLEALETIERALKVSVAYSLGQLDPFAHHTGQWHNQKHLVLGAGTAKSAHQQWRETHESKVQRRGDDAIAAFVDKYGTPLPVWVAVDVMDFGDVSKLIAQLGSKTQIALAREFGIRRGLELASWVRSMCLVRNIAAHHDRLWNRELVDVPTKPKGHEASHFAEIMDDDHWWSRTYATLLIVAYFIRHVDPTTTWPERVGGHLLQLPEGPGVSYRALGAPDEWISNSIWSLG
jgi:abortive infection bacteriophage resistance protein